MRIVPQTVQRDLSKDIAKGIAVISFIFAGSIYLPILGIFCTLFIPLPILYYRSKLGRANGVIIPGVAVFVMIVMLGGLSIGALFFIELLLLGFVLSELIELDLSIEKTLLFACSTILGTGIVVMFFYGNISNTKIVDIVSEYVKKILEITMSLYEKRGASEESLYVISNSLDNIHFYLVRIIPSLVVVQTIFVAWTNLLLARPMLKGKSLFYPDFGSLNVWKAPEFLVWCVIGSGLMLFLPDRTFKVIGLNGLIVLMTIYFFQGISIVSYYFEKKRIPAFLKVFFYCLIAIQQVILLLIIGIGFFDVWLNFRKLQT
jgi:uncharacterized protein YybS (DUF2232 family)